MKYNYRQKIKVGLLLAVTLGVIGCAAKQDFSGSDELAKSKTPAGQTATSAPKGASVHQALMVPQQRHP